MSGHSPVASEVRSAFIGLAFHAAYYFIGDDGTKNRRYQAFLAQERAREEHDST